MKYIDTKSRIQEACKATEDGTAHIGDDTWCMARLQLAIAKHNYSDLNAFGSD